MDLPTPDTLNGARPHLKAMAGSACSLQADPISDQRSALAAGSTGDLSHCGWLSPGSDEPVRRPHGGFEEYIHRVSGSTM